MKKLFLLIGLLISVNSFGQTVTLVCDGLEENTYEQTPDQNEKHKGTREYQFIDGKLNGRYFVQWTPEKIRYECHGGSGNGCTDKNDTSGMILDWKDIEISRNSGEITEYLSVKYNRKKLNISDSSSKFTGVCSKVEKKRF